MTPSNWVFRTSTGAIQQIRPTANPLQWKLPVPTYADLPTHAADGEGRVVEEFGRAFIFDAVGKTWQPFSEPQKHSVEVKVGSLVARILDVPAGSAGAIGNVKEIRDDGIRSAIIVEFPDPLGEQIMHPEWIRPVGIVEGIGGIK